MNILSLYDGMACAAIALKQAGIPIDEYHAYEIDPDAIRTATHNFPFIIEHGDIFNADFTQFHDIDIIMGGSPCTHWSIAQKKNRETTASGIGWELFSQYVKAIHEVKPKYFIYENNESMSASIQFSISSTFGFDPICINSATVSAQNRKRLYWVGKRNDDNTYSKVNILQPEDKGILLRDILDGAMDLTSNDKAWALTASYNGAVAWNTIERNQRNMVAEPICTSSEGKSHTLKAQYYKNGMANFITNGGFSSSAVAEPIQYEELSEEYYKGCADGSLVSMIENISVCRNGKQPSQQYRVYSCDSKSVCVDTDSRKHYIIPYDIDFNDSGKPIKATDQNGKEITIYEVHNSQIAIKGKHYPIELKDGYYIIRKLTIAECKRLQTVPDWYEFPVNNSQAYKMLGNGWTVDVIVHILRSIFDDQYRPQQTVHCKNMRLW